MPYQSMEERERARWATLREAVAHVRDTEGCDCAEAAQQIRAALADDVFGALWWGDSPLVLSLPGRQIIPSPSEPPPRWVFFWKTAEIDWKAGTVLDPSNPPRHRVLLLPRNALAQLWPPSKGADTRQAQGKDGNETLQPPPAPTPEPAPRPASEKALSDFVRKYIAEMKAAGRQPTCKELEGRWRAAGYKGYRDQLRAAFKSQMGDSAPTRGRLRRAAT
jgi:hypothetical protein